MPKTILIEPVEERAPGKLSAPDIDINAYQPDFDAEVVKFGKDGLARIYRDMLFIREFETMLDLVKREGKYQGIEYNHKGPAHLSIKSDRSHVVL